MSVNYKHGGDLRASIVNELRCVVPLPTPPAAPVDPNAQTNAEQTIQLIFKGEIDVYIKWRAILEDNIPKAYSIVLVQCTDLLQIKLKQHNLWDQVLTAQDVIQRLDMIKQITFWFEEK